MALRDIYHADRVPGSFQSQCTRDTRSTSGVLYQHKGGWLILFEDLLDPLEQ
jgi:hypothetical protein